jgi:hypothetical protein
MPDFGILSLMMGIVLVAFVAKGATGFGESLIIVPVFLLLLEFKTALPVALVTTAGADVYLLWHHHRDVHRKGLAVLVTAAVLGVVAGTLLLTRLDSGVLQQAFALFVLAFAVKLLVVAPARRAVREPRPGLATLSGGAGGLLDAVFGTGGPPLIMYLSWLGLPKSAFRATFVVLAFSLHTTRLVSYGAAGLLGRDVLLTGLALLPAMIGGALLGRRLHHRLDERLFQRLAAIVLLVIGVRLLLF